MLSYARKIFTWEDVIENQYLFADTERNHRHDPHRYSARDRPLGEHFPFSEEVKCVGALIV